MADGNDLARIWAKVEDREAPVFLSEADLLKVMQPHMTSTCEAAFALVRKEIPSIAKLAVKEFIAEQEEAERKLIEKLGVNRVNPLKAFIARNWGWVAAIVVLVIVLRPELAGHAISFLF